MHPRARELIQLLRLEPHPEGGYYRELFRSNAIVQPVDGRGPRSAATTIYYLLVRGTHSRWHQVMSDEVWHLYEGGPLELLQTNEDFSAPTRHLLDSAGRGAPVHTVPACCWQAARPLADYVLVGCTVAPGFDFEDFRMLTSEPELGERLRACWPEAADLI